MSRAEVEEVGLRGNHQLMREYKTPWHQKLVFKKEQKIGKDSLLTAQGEKSFLITPISLKKIPARRTV
jgi:hypothetical protein